MDSDDHRSTLVESVAPGHPSLAARAAWLEPIAILAVVCYQLLVVEFGVDALAVPALRTVAGIGLLSFLPGYLFVSLLADERSLGRTVVYSVGASVPIVVAVSLGFALFVWWLWRKLFRRAPKPAPR